MPRIVGGTLGEHRVEAVCNFGRRVRRFGEDIAALGEFGIPPWERDDLGDAPRRCEIAQGR